MSAASQISQRKPIIVNEGKERYSEDGEGTMRGGNILFRRTPHPDWFFMNGYPGGDFVTRVPWERRILFLMEPPMIEQYGPDYVKQFGVLVSPYAFDGYPGRLILDNTCLGWHTGLYSRTNPFKKLPDAENFPIPEKTKMISVISSFDKKTRVGHRKRIAFISALLTRYGEKIDYFGRGLNPVEDKLDAIVPYKYHIAIENCNLNNYWTEKLTDAWICWSLPIYCGDPSILRKIPDPLGMEVIDISDPMSAMRHIDYILDNDIYSSRTSAIAACRKWAIKKSNVLTRVCEIIESSDESVLAKPCLDHDDVIRRLPYKRRSFGEILGRTVSWCAGVSYVYNIKRKYGKILRQRTEKSDRRTV